MPLPELVSEKIKFKQLGVERGNFYGEGTEVSLDQAKRNQDEIDSLKFTQEAEKKSSQ